jgi:dihydroorotate dehydrogenase
MCGGGVASATDAIETIQYSAEEIQAITSTCRQMGNVHTTAHAYVRLLLLPPRVAED